MMAMMVTVMMTTLHDDEGDYGDGDDDEDV